MQSVHVCMRGSAASEPLTGLWQSRKVLVLQVRGWVETCQVQDVFTMLSCAARAPKTVVCLQAAQTGELVEDNTDIMHHGRRLQV